MKLKRLRRVRRELSFYEHNFGVRAPFRVLADGTFCKSALQFRVNIADQLPKYLCGQVTILTTKCVLAECEALGSLLFGPLNVLRQFDIHECGHPLPIPPATCIRNVCRKAKRGQFFVATQDRELSDEVRALPGVPLLYLSHNAISLEGASEASRGEASRTLAVHLAPTPQQADCIRAGKKQAFGEEEAPRKRKRKGPKEPNPLSCKKRKKTTAAAEVKVKVKVGRRRTRKRRSLAATSQTDT